MKAVRGIVLASACLANAAAARAAEVPERIFELSPFVGALLPDGNTNYKSSSPFAGLRAAINNSPRWAFEGMLGYSPRQEQSYRTGILESYDAFVALDASGQPIGLAFTNFETTVQDRVSGSDLLLAGGSIVSHFSSRAVRPFVALGGGYIQDISGGSGEGEPGSNFSHPYADFGAGFKFYRASGWSVRIEAHDFLTHQDDLQRPDPRAESQAAFRDVATAGGRDGVLGREPFDPDERIGRRWLHNWAITASIAVPLGWVWKDGDADRVADRFDQELTTAPNVVVDASGRGVDSDGDRVFDGIDRCPDTPAGATVDLEGCPSDADGDGVLDGLDLEPNTLAGATVDAQGRSADTDGDGVPNGVDLCPDTPKGAPIDDKGCPTNPFEERLLRGDRISIAGLGFDPGTDEIDPLSYHALNRMGPVLKTWSTHPESPRRIEITVFPSLGEGGGRGLAQARADALRTYLLTQFPAIAPDRLVASGVASPASGIGEGTRVELHATP